MDEKSEDRKAEDEKCSVDQGCRLILECDRKNVFAALEVQIDRQISDNAALTQQIKQQDQKTIELHRTLKTLAGKLEKRNYEIIALKKQVKGICNN